VFLRCIFAPAMSTDKEQQLIEGAMSIFMRYGIKSVNMDDVARQLGVSKKTLYLYFNDKEDLLSRVVNCHCKREDESITNIHAKKLTAIEEMFEIMHWVIGILSNIHPSVQYDMEKYHPELAVSMKANRGRVVMGSMLSNLKKGQKEGTYRKDFDAEVITRIYLSRMDAFLDPNLFPFDRYKPVDVYKELFQYHIRGIASAKGIEQLETIMKHKRK
jgi:AcrR family transcriptional regulator